MAKEEEQNHTADFDSEPCYSFHLLLWWFDLCCFPYIVEDPELDFALSQGEFEFCLPVNEVGFLSLLH